MGLPHMDDPLLILTKRLDAIRTALPDRKDWFGG
jgi:hypothetical protein